MKRIIKAFILFLLFALLPVPASAHPGKTDSAGGHTNHDTGEYHYHHGYSAHQHYDIDGDGVIDCPYNFKDNTQQSITETYPYFEADEDIGITSKKGCDFWGDILPGTAGAIGGMMILLSPFAQIFKKEDLSEKIAITGFKIIFLLIIYMPIIGLIRLFAEKYPPVL